MTDKKIISQKKAAKLIRDYKTQNKKTGLITGLFDVVYYGHIDLFRYAKEFVDILFIGLDTDETIRMTKGQHRPINNIQQRAMLISELISIDYVFELSESFVINEECTPQYTKILQQVNPDILISNNIADPMIESKRKICSEIEITLVEQDYILD